MKVKHVFPVETHEITSLKSHNMMLMFTTRHTVGFLKIYEESTEDIFCEAGTSWIQSVVVDGSRPNVIFAVSDRMIHVFEVKSSSNSNSNEECVPLGKFWVSINADFKVKGLWGYLWVAYTTGQVEVIKIKSLDALWSGAKSVILDGEGDPIEPILADAWGLIGNYILERKTENTSQAWLSQVRAPKTEVSGTNFVDYFLGFIG